MPLIDSPVHETVRHLYQLYRPANDEQPTYQTIPTSGPEPQQARTRSLETSDSEITHQMAPIENHSAEASTKSVTPELTVPSAEKTHELSHGAT